MIKLDSRLKMVASLVRKGAFTADIGTDHAYLLTYLVERGLCSGGIAADLRKGPLQNAKQTVIQAGLSDKIELVLSDGLENIKEDSCDDFVLAGMGGNLIAEILSKAPWIKNEKYNIIAQPMTHAEVLRQFFADNGFDIIKESTCVDGKHCYCAMSARYTGEKHENDISYIYVGRLFENKDKITREYINKLLFTLKKKHFALKAAGKTDEENLEQIIKEIEEKVEKTQWQQ